MLEKYDPNICFGRHTIRITLMQWDYVGHMDKEYYQIIKAEIEDFVDEIENLIVGIEIVDYVQKEW